MSWDVTVQRFSKEYEKVEDIPENEHCVALGSRAEVSDTISRYFPSTNWSDPCWGIFDSPHGSIEFNVGNDESNTGFMMHIRASENIVPTIVAMCIAEKWQALDCSSGEFLEKAVDPAAGLEQWADYRNKVINNA